MSRRTEEDIDLMHRMFECRKAARFLFQDGYQEAVKEYCDLVALVMKREKLMPLQAVLSLAKHIPTTDAVPVMMLMSAALDIIEREVVPA